MAEFYGHENRECGEHRTVGSHRAWCFDDGEWCYPGIPCRGCELPALRFECFELAGLLRLLVPFGWETSEERPGLRETYERADKILEKYEDD